MAENDFEQILKGIIDNPDIMEKISDIATKSKDEGLDATLPKIIEAISPKIKQNNEEISAQTDEKTDTSADKTQFALNFPLSAPFEKLSEKIAKNSKLLVALKPYLSKERSEIIDSVVKMAQIADLIKLTR